MDTNLYKDPSVVESAEKKLFRLKNKWLVESNIWMLAIIIIEWM